MGRLIGLVIGCLGAGLLSACTTERAAGLQLFLELLPARPGTNLADVASQLNQPPVLADSLGLVFQWKRPGGGRVRLEAYGQQRVMSLVSNFISESEDSSLTAYQALEQELRNQFGLPTAGRSGDYEWRNPADGSVVALRLLPDKKRLTLQTSRSPESP